MAMQIDLPYLVRDKDRFGQDRWYVRRRGRLKIRLRVEPGAPDFLPAYNAARDAIDNGVEREARSRSARASTTPGTIAYVAARYFGSPEFNGENLTDKSRENRRQVIEACVQEKLKNGNETGTIPRKCFRRRTSIGGSKTKRRSPTRRSIAASSSPPCVRGRRSKSRR